MESVLIGLGSNLDNPPKQIARAIKQIEEQPAVFSVSKSSLYTSRPQGPKDQDDFYNAVILIKTTLSPLDLLSVLQSIERQQGRIKTRRWGERNIDLDIIFYGDLSIQNDIPHLEIPHPQALRRDFVIIPALDVAPLWKLPDGSLLKDHRNSCLNHKLIELN